MPSSPLPACRPFSPCQNEGCTAQLRAARNQAEGSPSHPGCCIGTRKERGDRRGMGVTESRFYNRSREGDPPPRRFLPGASPLLHPDSSYLNLGELSQSQRTPLPAHAGDRVVRRRSAERPGAGLRLHPAHLTPHTSAPQPWGGADSELPVSAWGLRQSQEAAAGSAPCPVPGRGSGVPFGDRGMAPPPHPHLARAPPRRPRYSGG